MPPNILLVVLFGPRGTLKEAPYIHLEGEHEVIARSGSFRDVVVVHHYYRTGVHVFH